MILSLTIAATLAAGWILGFAQGSWRMVINGQDSAIPVHIIKNMYFVSLSDLAKVPGWRVSVDLSSRKVSLMTSGGSYPEGAGDRHSADTSNLQTGTTSSSQREMSTSN